MKNELLNPQLKLALRALGVQMKDNEFRETVAAASSIADVLTRMHRARVGTNYKMVKERIALLGLSTSHWGFQPISGTRPVQSLLHVGAKISTGALKKRILYHQLLPYVCSFCGNEGVWRGQPLVLRLDHINGVNRDHRLENLRFLCSNCDSQTPTYCGRNNKKGPAPAKLCSCGKPILRRSKLCHTCTSATASRTYKIEWPPLDELLRMTEELGFMETGRRLGVSDNSVRKHIKHAGGRMT